MRKNKTFEVNILSEQSSYVQTENASFYTSDTEAFLNFKPADADFNFTSATIALLNRDDSSLVSVDVTAVEGVAEYEMTPEVIAHFGNWVAQVVFKNDNESYTSGLISFDVNRYLMDERPPRLEDVESVSVLISEANAIISELEKAMSNMDFQKYDNHINNSAVHVTQANKNTWNNKQNALTAKEKEDFKRYTVTNVDGVDKTVSFAVINGQPVLRMEE